MTSFRPSEIDSNATDSVASSPRSDLNFQSSHDQHTRVRFMCSFGGKILPRPHDNQLRYVGGETRIVAVQRSTTFSALLTKLSKLSGTTEITIKYQLPNEDLDALISVMTDEDVENMMEEYDRLTHNQNPKSARLRLFLFLKGEDSRASSINSILGGSIKREHWFFDALNGGAASRLERGRSEVSSVVSEVPDYLFGLDNSDDSSVHLRDRKFDVRDINQDTVSVSDPGSPAPVASSSFYSRSSTPPVPLMLNLPPVKTRMGDGQAAVIDPKDGQPQFTGFVETNRQTTLPQQTGFQGETVHYIPVQNYSGHPTHQLPVYFLPGQIPLGNVPVQTIPVQAPYVDQYPTAMNPPLMRFTHPNPSPDQVFGGNPRAVTALDQSYDSPRVGPAGMNQAVYYRIRNPPAYPGMVAAGAEDPHGDANTGRIGQQ